MISDDLDACSAVRRPARGVRKVLNPVPAPPTPMTERAASRAASSTRRVSCGQVFGLRSVFGAAIAALAFGALAQPASAIEISKHATDSAEVNAIQLKGKIDDGDTFDLQVYIAEPAEEAEHRGLSELARRQSARRHEARPVLLPEQDRDRGRNQDACASACALAFLGGRDGEPASRSAPRRRPAASASTRSPASSTRTRATPPTI